MLVRWHDGCSIFLDMLKKIIIALNLYVISVQRKLMIFNTFLFIYLFFCYNYSFIYLLFCSSFFFFLYERRIMVEYLSFVRNITSGVPCRWLFSVISLETLLLMAFPDLHPSSFSTEISPVLNFMNHTRAHRCSFT